MFIAFFVINSQTAGWQRWQHAVDAAADIDVDALIIVGAEVMAYAAEM